ncbi:uncharacterized protein LOC129731047 [Wyeomyia smithii]|uniref:uncharacterized protein LOC129731047 n=1 Tax=Wyeomyia smithii TaxID=174621 RepID=UPI0024680BC7|nr:uncharacterized protein LOC129731047 [Wyeomyia smithii]XP_055546748.1 uncharacterized protein LOC129731047 [Wyeomyia smithii]XP_055546749.1 uncharacterized protein LOC129731047 [Wyeomyia smithii]
MCRCCQSCWEELYWNCIEERFCYDETIAHYDPEEDEYASQKKAKNGFYNPEESMENNNAPICRQPAGLARNMSMSSKVHEDDLRREIQTNVPMLAPEVMAVFAHSQIFQEHAPPKSTLKSPASVKFAISSDSSSIDTLVSPFAAKPDPGSTESKREDDSDKLLKRLEGSRQDIRESRLGPTVIIPEIVEEDQDNEVILRPPRSLIEASTSFSSSAVGLDKTLSTLQATQPYFSVRPASENDIFTISTASSGYNAISMTPEVPAISYSNLPKNYLETPTVDKYRESVSLYSIQTASVMAEKDYSMPRYYRKSDLFVNRTDRSNSELANSSSSVTTTPARQAEKSKRLMNIRTALPPLNLTLIRGTSSANLKEREREAKEKDKLKAKQY